MIRVVTFLLCFAFCALVQAQTNGTEFRDGVHYYQLAQPVSVHQRDKIEVAEVFRYDCPGCFQFDSTVSKWRDKLPADVVFEYVPAPMDKLREHYAKAYYTARALGILAAVHQTLFDEIHVHRNRLQRPEDLAKLFAKHGVDEATTLKTYNSFGISSLAKQAEARIRGYGINSTPSLVVQGKYRIEINNNVKNYDDLLAVADFLIRKVRAEKS